MPNDLQTAADATLPADTERWVLAHLVRSREPGAHGIEDVAEVALHPTADLVACTVTRRSTGAEPVTRHVALVDLGSGRHRVLDLDGRESRGADWSADGRLAVVATATEGVGQAVVLGAPADPAQWLAEDRSPSGTGVPTDGLVEAATWSPDGRRLALLVARAGAEISDVHGTGTIGGPDAPTWRPRVLPATGPPRRVVTVWDGSATTTAAADNVWELGWCGSAALVLVTSAGSGEGDWYAPRLTRLDLASGRRSTLYEPVHQLAQPRAAPGGRRWSVLAGLQSDRGLPAGDLVVGDAAGHRAIDTGGVHVTGHHWLTDDVVLLTGLRGLRTVTATLDIVTGERSEAWSGDGTSGEYQPEVAGRAGRDPVVVLEGHDRPPALGVLAGEGFRPVLTATGPGTAYQVGVAGTTTALRWTSDDGTEVEGLLTLPEGPGPHPLVVAVHGGPVHAWRATWSGRDPHLTVLVARGYAVLRPNVRGSTGRGSAYVAGVWHDMGGGDVDDLLAGVRLLVGRGVADPARIGVTGISYGGFLSCWLPCVSDVFAAAVARSPVTDWVGQHLTSNIAEFDAAFLAGHLWDPDSQYRTRSPLAHHERCTTPLLLTAGRQDLATPCAQAQVMYAALAERGLDTALVVYPDEGHGVWRTETLADQLARMLAWFERHMPARTDTARPRPPGHT